MLEGRYSLDSLTSADRLSLPTSPTSPRSQSLLLLNTETRPAMSNDADYDFAVPMPSQRKDERPASPAGNDERTPKSNHDQMGSSWSMGPVPNMMSSLGSSVSSEVTWNAMSSSHGNIDLNFQNHSTIAIPPYFDNGTSVGNWNSMIPSPVVFDHSAVQQPFAPARTVQSYLNSGYASGSLGLFDSTEITIGGLPHWTYSSGLDLCSFGRSQQSTQPVSFAPNAFITPIPGPAPAQNSVAIDASGSSAFAHLCQNQMNNPWPIPFQAQRASFLGGWSARSTNQEQG